MKNKERETMNEVEAAEEELTAIMGADPRKEILLAGEDDDFSFASAGDEDSTGVDVFAVNDGDGSWSFGVCTQVGPDEDDEPVNMEGMKDPLDLPAGEFSLFVDKLPLWLAFARRAAAAGDRAPMAR